MSKSLLHEGILLPLAA